MAWYDRYVTTDGEDGVSQPPGQAMQQVGPQATTNSYPGSQWGNDPRAGQKVPGRAGFVYNSAGGMEPGGAGNAVIGQPGMVYGPDGYNTERKGRGNRRMGGPATTNTPATTNSGSFRDKIIANLTKANPTKAKDPNWLKSQADYFEGRLASGDPMGNGQRADEAYYLERALGKGAGGADTAEAGPYAGQDFGSLEQQQGGGAFGDPFEYSMGSLLTPWTEDFHNRFGDAPQWEGIDAFRGPGDLAAGRYTRPGDLTAPKFEYGEFKLPGGDELLAQDPGYAFRKKEGLGARENSAAARGTLHTGAALKGLEEYGSGLASQEYGNAAGRALGVYTTNRDTAQGSFDRNTAAGFGTYDRNRQSGLDEFDRNEASRFGAWDRNFQSANTGYGYAAGQNSQRNAQRERAYNTNYGNSLGEFLQRYNQFRNNQNDQYSRLHGLASLGRG